MRHLIAGRKLNRKSSHRKALFKNLSNSLIINEQIKTTLPKAKDLRSIVEKIITLGKNETIHSKRKVFSILRSNQSVDKVFNTLAKRYDKRNGGYTRVLKAGYRYGDSSPMAIIEFVERDINAKGLLDKERLKLENKEVDKSSDQSINSDNKSLKKPVVKESKKSEANETKKPKANETKKFEAKDTKESPAKDK